MNIFVLSRCPKRAAWQQCDKHSVKMVLESAQILCAPFEPGTAPYKRTHYNHPCTKWARSSRANYIWLLKHAIAQAKEYTFRYGRKHKSETVIVWCLTNWQNLELPDTGMTPFAQAMPEQYKSVNILQAYRNFYLNEKASFAKWEKSRQAPYWWRKALTTKEVFNGPEATTTPKGGH